MAEENLFVRILLTAIPLIVAVVVHEVAHGYIAERLGDPTARRLGRITLNPIRHIDPMMTIVIPGLLILMNSPFVFGGAKPVPINPLNFKNPKRDMGWVAAAGPISNVILALIGYGVLWLVLLGPDNVVFQFATRFLVQWLIINVVLAVFNLLPVPPLDGGRIAVALLPRQPAALVSRLEPYGLMIVMALLLTGTISSILSPVLGFVFRLMGFDVGA